MSIRLYILGTLAKENNHPYKIKKKLVKWLPNNQFSEGKFYYNFEALEKKGYIQEIEVIQDGKKPDKTLYTITDTGKKDLEQLIYDSFKKYADLQELHIPIFLLEFVDPTKVAAILKETIIKEQNYWEELKNRKVNNKQINEKTKQSVNFISAHAISNAQHNIEWLEKLLDFVENQTK